MERKLIHKGSKKQYLHGLNLNELKEKHITFPDHVCSIAKTFSLKIGKKKQIKKMSSSRKHK
jgi:hypothetical protein